jgi:dipeptidyl aminopeptidase/acylaminoacyl peptidase
MLTGRPPFRGLTWLETLEQVRSSDPVPPSGLQPKLPPELERICLKAMAKEPTRRYTTSDALADDLRRWLDGEPIHAQPVGRLQQTWRWVRQSPGRATLAATLALALAAGTGGITWQWRRAEADLEKATAAQAREVNARKQAERQAGVAQTLPARQLLYVHQMNLAQRAWRDREYDRFNALLSDQIAEPGEPDLRGWEWYHARRKFNANSFSHSGQFDLGVTAMAFTPDGRRIATGSLHTVKFWDPFEGVELITINGHNGGVTSLAFSPDGRWIVSGGGEYIVRLRDAASGQGVWERRATDVGVANVAFSPDGRRVASSGNNDEAVWLWDATNGQEILRLNGHRGGASSLAFSPDSRRIASCANNDEAVWLWDATNGQELLMLDGHKGGVSQVAFSPDGRRIGSAGKHDEKVKLWDTTSGQIVLTLFGPSNSSSIAFSPDGRRIAAAGTDNLIRVWELITGHVVQMLDDGRTDSITSVAFSPDGQWLASAGSDGKVILHDGRAVPGELMSNGRAGSGAEEQ